MKKLSTMIAQAEKARAKNSEMERNQIPLSTIKDMAEKRIAYVENLEAENAKLKEQIAALKKRGAARVAHSKRASLE